MKRPTRLVLSIAVLLLPAPLVAQTPKDSVIRTVNEWFTAMTARDTATTARLQIAEGMSFGLREQGDTVAYFHRSNTAYVRQLATMRETWVERIWDSTVLVHGPLATLWAPYDIYTNGKFTHCGVDAFTLIRTKGGWKIATVAFTMEPTGCPPSPLGPLSQH